jgi:hypothetical protein
MRKPRVRIKTIPLAGLLLILASPLTGVARGGGFGKSVYIPVQATNQVAAAPAYAAPSYLVAAPSHHIFGTHKLAAAPLYQVAAAPAYPYAAAPAYSYAAAPAYPYAAAPASPYAAAPAYPYAAAPAYPYAAAPTYPYAAAPGYTYAAAPTVKPQAAPKVAAAPAPKPGQIYYHPSYGYVMAPPAAAPGALGAPSADDLGKLDESQFNKIVETLRKRSEQLSTFNFTPSQVRAALTNEASDNYSTYTKIDDLGSADNAAVKALVDAALGDTDTSASDDKSKQQATPAGTAVAAPFQLFIPVQIKHPHHNPYYR